MPDNFLVSCSLVFLSESFVTTCILNCDIIRPDEFQHRCVSLVREDRVEGNVNEHWKTRSLALMSLDSKKGTTKHL